MRLVLPRLGEKGIDLVFRWLIDQPFGVDLYVQHANLVSLLADILGVDLVVLKILRLPTPSRKRLLAHLDWSGEFPVVAEKLLEADDELQDEASRRFLYPGEIVTGPYSLYLTSRRDILTKFVQGERDPRVRDWARELLPVMNEMIAQEQLREEEEDR